MSTLGAPVRYSAGMSNGGPAPARGRISSFTVVTPCYQAVSTILATAESVLKQSAVRSGRVRLQYLVCDGASTDGTVEAVRRLAGSAATVLSEPDRGMYDALAKGLQRAEGDVVSYLNAGDLYHPAALDVVADVFESGRVRWLTGLNVHANHRGQITQVWLPYRYRRAHIRRGVFGGVLGRAIQQDATFWDRELHAQLDLGVLAGLRLAGDFYLWRRFAEVAELDVVDSHLGTFLRHPGQLSEDRAGYLAELRSLAEPRRPWDVPLARLDRLLGRSAGHHRKAKLNPRHLWRWDERAGSWRTRR